MAQVSFGSDFQLPNYQILSENGTVCSSNEYRILVIACIMVSFLPQKSFKAMGAGWMAQFPQGLGFNLADSFASHMKFQADLLQRMFGPVFKAKSHSNHVLLA